MHNNVLSLAEIGSMALSVKATRNEPSTHATSVLPRDQHEAGGSIHCLDRDEAVDDWHSEWGVLDVDELLQHLVIEGELGHVVDAVGVDVKQIRAGRLASAVGVVTQKSLKSCLHAFCQVERVAEVERAVFLQVLDHVNELLVSLGPTPKCKSHSVRLTHMPFLLTL